MFNRRDQSTLLMRNTSKLMWEKMESTLRESRSTEESSKISWNFHLLKGRQITQSFKESSFIMTALIVIVLSLRFPEGWVQDYEVEVGYSKIDPKGDKVRGSFERYRCSAKEERKNINSKWSADHLESWKRFSEETISWKVRLLKKTCYGTSWSYLLDFIYSW